MKKIIIKAIGIAVQSGVSTILWGNPGIGKTAIVKKIADALGYYCETLIASLRDPTEFAGVNIVIEDNTKLAPPEWVKRIQKCGKPALAFFDEITTCAPAVQHALLRVILEGVIGDVKLENTRFIAAANTIDVDSNLWALVLQLSNRFCHIMVEPDTDAWLEYMTSKKIEIEIPRLPENWQSYVRDAKTKIAAFIMAKPMLLMKMPSVENVQYAWPSPRSWEMAATVYGAAISVNEPEIAQILTAGCVGPAAQEFITYMKNLDIPTPQEILKNPDKIRIPSKSDIVYATVTGTVLYVEEHPTQQNYNALVRYLKRVYDAEYRDLAFSVARQTATIGIENGLKIPDDLVIFKDILDEIEQLKRKLGGGK